MKKSKQNNQPTIRSRLLDEYLDYLKNNLNQAESTIYRRRFHAIPFLIFVGKKATPSKIDSLRPQEIHDYVIDQTKNRKRHSKKDVTSSLRSFLRFLHICGYTRKDLSDAVPKIICWNLESVPRALRWEQVEALLKAPDRNTAMGRRDYAILLLLATYGLRIGQATQLKRQHIDWDKKTIFFPEHKRSKPLCFPLSLKVARAILDYIKIDRPPTDHENVFLNVGNKHRHKPISKNNKLCTSFKLYYNLANIDFPTNGAHAIRHAFATRLLKKKKPLKVISDLLGHRFLNTTYLYTKVDFDQLRLMTCDWPEKGGEL